MTLRHPSHPATLSVPEPVDLIQPRPLLSDADWARFVGSDLAGEPDVALVVESKNLRAAVRYAGADATQWSRWRLGVIEETIARRLRRALDFAEVAYP